MKNNPAKLQVYKGMIQYILESTSFKVENIADLTDCSLEDISSIYDKDIISLNTESESQLVKLYQMLITLKPRKYNNSSFRYESN